MDNHHNNNNHHSHNNNNNNNNHSFSSDWSFPQHSNQQYSFNYSSNEPLQEPVPFEDFQFSLDFNIPLPLEMPPVPIPGTDMFAEPVFSNNLEQQQHQQQQLTAVPPPPPNGAVLDENERKAFSQFLDSFCGDQNMQFDPHQFAFFDQPPPMSLDPYHEDEQHRQNSILQSLDEQKRYYSHNNNSNSNSNSGSSVEEQHTYKPQVDRPVYLQQSSAISPPYIKPIRETSSSTTATPIMNSTSTSTASPAATAAAATTKEITSGGAGGGGAVRRGKPHKELLTEEEKRNNHIASEQKRRSMIRSGFKDLTEIVPTLKNINNSKSTVLFKAVDYIKYLEKRNKNLREKIKNLEIRVEVEGRMGALGHQDHYYKGSTTTNAALLQHKTQQKQLMELQEKLQLHQRLLAQQQHHHQKGGHHHHYMFDNQEQQARWHATDPTAKEAKMEVDTTSGELLKATVSA